MAVTSARFLANVLAAHATSTHTLFDSRVTQQLQACALNSILARLRSTVPCSPSLLVALATALLNNAVLVHEQTVADGLWCGPDAPAAAGTPLPDSAASSAPPGGSCPSDGGAPRPLTAPAGPSSTPPGGARATSLGSPSRARRAGAGSADPDVVDQPGSTLSTALEAVALLLLVAAATSDATTDDVAYRGLVALRTLIVSQPFSRVGAVCNALIQRSVRQLLSERYSERVQQVARDIMSCGVPAHGVTADVGRADDVDEFYVT